MGHMSYNQLRPPSIHIPACFVPIFCISQESNRIVETDHKLSNVQRSRERMRKGFSGEEKEKEGLLSTSRVFQTVDLVRAAF